MKKRDKGKIKKLCIMDVEALLGWSVGWLVGWLVDMRERMK
jgi:hypothetical protein